MKGVGRAGYGNDDSEEPDALRYPRGSVATVCSLAVFTYHLFSPEGDELGRFVTRRPQLEAR